MKATNKKRRSGLRIGVTVVAAALVSATTMMLTGGTAFAQGGTTIAGASTATIGVTEYGNTATDTVVPGEWANGSPNECVFDYEVWEVTLAAGDQVTVAGGVTAPASDFTILFMPAGTTDGEFESLNFPSATFSTGLNVAFGSLGQALRFIVPSDGTYPFVVGANMCAYSGTDGPYFFKLTVVHEAKLFTRPLVTTGTSGFLRVIVRRTDGSPITSSALTVVLSGYWKDRSYVPISRHLLAKAHPVNGEAIMRFVLPKAVIGTRIKLVASGLGGDFKVLKRATTIAIVK